MTDLCEALQKKGASIRVYCSQPTLVQRNKQPTHSIHHGIRITRLWSFRFPKLSIVGKLLNHISFAWSCLLSLLRLPKHSTVLLFTNPPLLPLLMLLVYPIKRHHYTVVVFDMYPETLVAAKLLSPSHFITKGYQALNRLVYQRAHHTVSIGRCMKQHLDTLMAPKKSTYIPIWATPPALQQQPDSQRFRKQWGLTDRFIVGYSGNLARFHPIETFAQAAKKALQEAPHLAFVFVGEGAKKEWLRRFKETHHLSNCHLYSYVERVDLPDLLASFDCGLVGLNPENTGYSVPSKTIGLLHAGCPIVACCSPKCEVARLINNYECGLHLPATDATGLCEALTALATDNERCQLYAQQAKRAYQDVYNLHTIATQYYHLLSNPSHLK